MSDAPEYENILEPRDQVMADLAMGVLQGEGIPAVLQSFQVPWYNGIMTAGAGAWGRILVPARFAADARRLLTAYFAGEGVDPDTAAPDPADG